MKKLDDLYPLFSKGNIALIVSGLLALLLGIVLFFVGEAELVGLVILLSSFVMISAILLGTAILSLVSRYLIRKQVVGIRGSILFINKSHWSKLYVKEFIYNYLKFHFDRELVKNLSEKIDSRLGWSLRMTDIDNDRGVMFAKNYLPTTEDFEPITFCYLKDEGDVILEWGNIRKKVAGLQYGHVVEVDMSCAAEDNEDFTMPELAVGLIIHELEHVLLSEKFPNTSTSWQHAMMSFPIKNKE